LYDFYAELVSFYSLGGVLWALFSSYSSDGDGTLGKVFRSGLGT